MTSIRQVTAGQHAQDREDVLRPLRLQRDVDHLAGTSLHAQIPLRNLTAAAKGMEMVSVGRPLAELTRDESLRLLASVAMGRIVFTDQVLPVVRPVNHLLDDGHVIIRSHLGSALVRAAARPDGVVVAYEADAIDPQWTAGWSVVVIGTAHLVREPTTVAGYQRLLQPWVEGNMDQIIRIGSEIITGFRLPGGPNATRREPP